MPEPTDLETQLREHPITNGVIQLSILDGQWMCTIAHRVGHQTHQLGRFSTDPVEALRTTLIEDERHDRECRRKFAASSKMGSGPADEFSAALTDEFSELLG